MKLKIFISLLSLSLGCFGQIQGHLYSLQIDSNANIVVGELGLFYRPKANQEIPITLGKQWVEIIAKYAGKELPMEINRMHCRTSHSFTLNGQTYLSVVLFHDNGTTDPRDDIALVSIPFPVDEKLLTQGYGQNPNETIAKDFSAAPRGKPNYELD